MGNEKSGLSGLEVDEKALEITDFWLHHSATVTKKGSSISPATSSNLSVFISEPALHSSGSFGKPTPLEKNAKNLMIHRHPCILRYISSWRKNSLFYLATEEVKPLAQIITIQTSLQICIGLHNILKALNFLHEAASASHLNVCTSSIYVTPEGSWRLAGLEYLAKHSEFSEKYLTRIKQFRCEKTLAPEEESSQTPLDPVAIDQFAFGVLAEDLLRMKTTDEVPALLQFRELCKKGLQNPDPILRPKLSSILQHPFFTHDFISIHGFLMELPLKNEEEKEEFFSGLVDRLKQFPEKIVAEQLGNLLLSRMVLLDPTAQSKLLPFILKPRNSDEDSSGLFLLATFKAHLVPKLLQMFCVRDISIRLLLLDHLNSFVNAFQQDELKKQILPELLVGIKDENDKLVSVTLRSLADLVPILGAAGVIGGKRGRLFTDGRPNRRSVGENASAMMQKSLNLPERPSPDGGEDRLESPVNLLEDETTWSDWESQETQETMNLSVNLNVTVNSDEKKSEMTKFGYKKHLIEDINELDIKNSKLVNVKEEEDFFTDMEPVIEKTKVVHVKSVELRASKSVFDVEDENGGDAGVDDGWGNEDLSDWGGGEDPDLRI